MTDTNQKLREALLSDMDIAVLRMPVHLAFAGNMAQFQYHNRVQALLDRIEALATPTAEQVDDINVAESFTSVTKTAAPAQGEPFGHFRAEPFGWTDCSEDAEGAIALYEHPAKPAVPQGWVKASDRMPLDGYSDGLREIADELDAVQKDLAGIELQADGNANFYWLMRDGKWIAKIQMNGEMLVDKQVALLEAMLSAGTQIAHCPKCFTCFEVGSGSTEQNPWRDAVIEQLESWHICVPAIHDNSPRLAIKALVNIETKAALDPAVSSEAAALVAGQHNNAPAVPQGEPVAWMVYGNYTRQPFGMLSSAEAYMRGLLKSDPDRACAIRRNYQPPSPNRSNP